MKIFKLVVGSLGTNCYIVVSEKGNAGLVTANKGGIVTISASADSGITPPS